MLPDRALDSMPSPAQRRIRDVFDAMKIATRVENKKVLVGLAPSVTRGFLLKEGKQGEPVGMRASHDAYFDFRYQGDYPEMYDLYRRAVKNQWDGDTQLDWATDVDPRNPEKPVFPIELVPMEGLAAHGIRLDRDEQMRFVHDFSCWLLSQFLHGEQGALYRRGTGDRERAVVRRQVLRRHAGDGRGTARRGVPPLPRDEAGQALPGQRQPVHDHRRADARLALGHEVPRHADHDRGTRARRLRHDVPVDTRAAAEGTAPLRDPGRGAPRSLRRARAEAALRRTLRQRAARARGLGLRGGAA